MVRLSINGQMRDIDVEPDTPLLWVIREQAGLTGTKYGCGIAQCGACTVHIDGTAVRSCSMPVSAVTPGQKIVTIEGLSPDGSHPLQKAWIALDVPQCGYLPIRHDHGRRRAAGRERRSRSVDDIRDRASPISAAAAPTTGCSGRHPAGGRRRQALPRLRGTAPMNAARRTRSSPPRLPLRLVPPPAPGTDRRSARRCAQTARLPHPARGQSPPRPPPAIPPEVNAWVVVKPDDTVVIRIARSEMGQGTLTGLAQLVVEELDCDWAKVTTEYPTPGQNLARNRVWQATSPPAAAAASANPNEYVRKGGAAARMMLVQAAANGWGVPASPIAARRKAW